MNQASALANGGFSFSFSAVPGQNYQIQVSTNLLDWALLSSVLATNSTFQYVGPGATNRPQGFYRVAVP